MAKGRFTGAADAGGGLGTVDDNYKRMAKAGVPGFVLPEDEAPSEDLAHLLVWHTDLRNRAGAGFGPAPVTLEAIEVYGRHLARLGIEMEPFDFDLLCRLDNVWLTAQSEAVVKTER